MNRDCVAPPDCGPSGDDTRLDGTTAEPEPTTKYYVRDCPYRTMGIPSLCYKLPEHRQCGSDKCRNTALTCRTIDYARLPEKAMPEFIIATSTCNSLMIYDLIATYRVISPNIA